MNPEELERMIQTAMQGQAAASGAAQQTAAALSALTRASSGQTTASSLAAQASNNLADSQAKANSASSRLGSALVESSRGLMGLMQSIYGAEKAFTGVIPALDTYSTMLQSTLKLLGDGLSGVGIQIGTLGINIGKLSTIVANRAIDAIKFLTDGLKLALDSTQKVTDSYISVAKHGATFGTSISEFARTAKDAGVPLQQFAKIVQSNIDSISKLGIGIQKGSQILAAYTSDLFQNDKILVAQYGSMEELAKGTGEYLALQSQLGVDVRKNYLAQAEGAREYLLRQKELANMTGKSTDALKQAEEARRKELAYSLKLSRLGPEAQQNVQEGIEMAGKMFGPAGERYAKEFFATGGQVISKESLEFAGLMESSADAINQMLSTVDRSRSDYQRGNAAYLEKNKAVLEEQARLGEDFAVLGYASSNAQLKMMNEVNSNILSNLTSIKSYTDVIAAIAADRAKYGTVERQAGDTEGKFVLERKVALDAQTESFVAATESMRQIQMTMDTFIVNQMMPKMGEVATAIGEMALKQVEMIDYSLEALKKMTDLSDTAVDKLNKWADSIKEKLTGELAGSLLENIQRPPRFADGGITSGPSIAGENGPEAVIPLAKGSVPMNIDWTPLVNILRENTELNREILDALEDSVDVQNRILQASY